MCFALLGACKKSTVTFFPSCSSTVKSFNNDVLPIISSRCKGCHSQYSGYSQIAGDKSSIRSTIVDGSMPKESSLSTSEKNDVVCWIDNGALNN